MHFPEKDAEQDNKGYVDRRVGNWDLMMEQVVYGNDERSYRKEVVAGFFQLPDLNGTEECNGVKEKSSEGNE